MKALLDTKGQMVELERFGSEQSGAVGVAVVGCGRISDWHLEAITSQSDITRLVAVVDGAPERAREKAARYGARLAFADISEALAVDEVEAVAICTPNELHTEHSLAALRAGRHVLVEKPMAEDAEAAGAMAEAAERARRVLAVGQTFRHSPAVRLVQDRLDQFGTLHAVEVSHCVFWDGPQAPWWRDRTPEQGLILSLFAPHALDFVQLVLRDAPLRVHVEAARHQHAWKAEDEAMILLGYSNRRMASVHISYNQQRVVDRKVLMFDQGLLRIEDGERVFWNDELLLSPADDFELDSLEMRRARFAGYFRTQYMEFARAVRGLANRSVLHDEGRGLIELIDRVRHAARDSSAASVE